MHITTATISVRVDPQTRQVLAEAAASEGAAGASGLAREILTQWAHKRLAAQTQADIKRVAEYMKAHPEGWSDEPAAFFPQATRSKKAR